jgi:DNA-binding NarL/FixJ family response regulator
MPWKNRTKTYVMSAHPLALGELGQWLASDGVASEPVRLECSLKPVASAIDVPRGSVCVVDACFPPAANESLISTLMARYPETQLLVLTDELSEALVFPLLRLGVKGLLPYGEARKHLLAALGAVATGGCWLPRRLLARFLDSLLDRDASARATQGPLALSRREQEVFDALLENLSNKEIASRLNISERTVKFHVSNLLAKFSVERRSDLILKSLQHARL